MRMADPVFDLDNRVILLTGGCGLIGRTAAAAFVERGARLVVADVAPKDPEAFASDLGGRAAGMIGDVSSVEDVRALREAEPRNPSRQIRSGRTLCCLMNRRYASIQVQSGRHVTFSMDFPRLATGRL